MAAPIQRNFSGGELAPSLYARTDLAKYATGLRQCRNFIVQRHGGVTLRSGTVYVADAKSSAVRCLLIPFVRDSTLIADTFVLELGDSYARFYQNGARVIAGSAQSTVWMSATTYYVGDLVMNGTAMYYCTVSHSSMNGTNSPGTDPGWQTYWYQLAGPQSAAIYEIPTPYTTADLTGLRWVQAGDIISLVHPGYAPRELRRYAATRWILTPAVFGPSISAPANVAGTGGAVGGPTYYAVTALKQGSLEESLAGVATVASTPTTANPINVTWNPVAGAVAYRLYRGTDQKTYGLLQTAGGQFLQRVVTVWTTTNSTISSSNPAGYIAAGTQLRNPLTGAITATQRAIDQTYTVKFTTTLSSGLATTGFTRGRVGLYYQRNTDSARVFYGYLTLDPASGPGWTLGPNAAVAQIVVPDNGYTSLTIDLVPEIWPGAGGSNCSLTIDSGTAPNNSVSWSEDAVSFSDANAVGPDYKQAPPTQQALFNSPGNYPAAVGRYQQRFFLASTGTDPEKSWGSRAGVYSSFAISTPIVANDAISFVVSGNRVNVVKHLLDLGRLVVFGSDAIYTIDGDNSGAIAPATLNTRKSASHGIGSLRPLEVDDSAIYQQARGTIIRDLKPRRANPSAMGAYEGTDLTVFANHLFDGYTIVDWAYQEVPHSIVWAVRSDGVLLSLTYLREHEVWAWARHDTPGGRGVVENVCVIPEGPEDALYLVVRRVINGVTRRMIERMSPRYWSDIRLANYLDCALTYDGRHTGTTTMTLSGGVAWDATQQLTLTASVATFAAGDVNANAYFLWGADGSFVRCTVEAFTSTTVVTVRPDRLVPVGMRTTAIGNGTTFVIGALGYLGQWAKAVKTVTGATQLEGQSVGVVADGFVVASPNNVQQDGTATFPARVVSGGSVTLDQPYAVITVGLSFIGDLETLDLDGGQNTTIKDTKLLVSRLGIYVTDARGIWAGRSDKPTAANPLLGLNEVKARYLEPYDQPPALRRGYLEINIDNTWSDHGRIFVRQVDPVPLTVLSITPMGYLGGGS